MNRYAKNHVRTVRIRDRRPAGKGRTRSGPVCAQERFSLGTKGKYVKDRQAQRLGWGVSVIAVSAVLACVPLGVAGAETMNEALAATYKFNPRLDAARSTLRATDEEVPRALSGYRPTITGNADTSFERTTVKPP